jgi:hypothetical protein
VEILNRAMPITAQALSMLMDKPLAKDRLLDVNAPQQRIHVETLNHATPTTALEVLMLMDKPPVKGRLLGANAPQPPIHVETLNHATPTTALEVLTLMDKPLVKGRLRGANAPQPPIHVGICKAAMPIIARAVLIVMVELPAKVHSLGANVRLQTTHAVLHNRARPGVALDQSAAEWQLAKATSQGANASLMLTRRDSVGISYHVNSRVAMEKSSILAVTWVFVKGASRWDALVCRMLKLPASVVRLLRAMPMAARERRSVPVAHLVPVKRDLRSDVVVCSNCQRRLRHLHLVQQAIVKMTAWPFLPIRWMGFQTKSVQMTLIMTSSILEALQRALRTGGGSLLIITAIWSLQSNRALGHFPTGIVSRRVLFKTGWQIMLWGVILGMISSGQVHRCQQKVSLLVMAWFVSRISWIINFVALQQRMEELILGREEE